jgi:hypothetical protein
MFDSLVIRVGSQKLEKKKKKKTEKKKEGSSMED